VENKNYTAEKKNYPKGSVIITQGSTRKNINFIHSGTLEILRCRSNIAGFDSKEILSRSRRIGIIESPSIFGISNLFNSDQQSSSLIAMTDCVITTYNINDNDFVSFFINNPPISMNVLVSMKEDVRKSIVSLKKLAGFRGLAEKMIDNLKLFYAIVVDNQNDEYYKLFVSSGGIIPVKVDSRFLSQDNSVFIGKNYNDPQRDPLRNFDMKTVEFFNGILKANPAAFIAIIKSDIKVFLHLHEMIQEYQNRLNSEIEQITATVEDKLSTLFFEPDSVFNLIVADADKIRQSQRTTPDITKSIVVLCRNVEHLHKQLTGKEYTEVFKKYDILNADSSKQKDEKRAVVSTSGIKLKLKGSTELIIDYAGFKEEKKSTIIRNLLDIDKLDMNDLFGKQTRTILKKQQDDFIDLYLACFIKSISDPSNIPLAVRLFLNYGYISENLLNEENLDYLVNGLEFFESGEELEFPIIGLYKYLTLIYNGTETPSLTETGELFSKEIKRSFGKNEKVIEDTPMGRLEFEVANMVKSCLRITSNNLRAYIPYLNDESIKGQLSNVLVTPKKLESFIKRIVMIDFSLFFRESSWKAPGKSELIKKEIRPYFILVPNAGLRVQMWQEMINNIRTSRGRFVVPAIFNSDLNKALLWALAHFRWELSKNMATNWMDAVEGGLCGSYYDYSQYYHKNPELSLEAKEKIKKEFSSLKMDRDRFAADYCLWIDFESKGVPKLNKVVRSIFYRFIPFTKDIRENVAKLPLFGDLDRKFTNTVIRNNKKNEMKIRRLLDNSEIDISLKDELAQYLDMLDG